MATKNSKKTAAEAKVVKEPQPTAKAKSVAKPAAATETKPVAQPTTPKAEKQTTADKKPALKEVVFNGINYEMSDQDYASFTAHNAKLQEINTEIQKILSRAHVSDKDELLKGELTPKAMEYLVGHPNVMYYVANESGYDHNTCKYNGYNIDKSDPAETELLIDFAGHMRTIPGFCSQYTIETPVVMTIGSNPKANTCTPVKDPRYSKEGRVTVGNIVVRNNKTGKLELYCAQSWLKLFNYSDAKDAATMMLTDFTDVLGADVYDICNAFALAHATKTK